MSGCNSHFKHNLLSGRTELHLHPATICCRNAAAVYSAPALASPLHNLTSWFKKGKKTKHKKKHFRSVFRPWCLVTTETTNFCTFERKDVEGGRGGETEGKRGRKKPANWWKQGAGSSMYSYVSLLREAGSSQDLNVSIMHEVVLRYANMNYLTSRADLLLRLTLSPSHSIPVHLYHSLLISLLSILTHFAQKSASTLRTASFSWNRLRWIIHGSASLPLCLSAPFIDFLLLTISTRFVWVLSASSFVFEAEGETQALVRWTFDEEESSLRTRGGRERACEVHELFLLLIAPSSL